MIKYLPVAPFVAALLMASCGGGGSDPVADNVMAPPDSMLGDASATGLADPANSGRAEAARQAALPPSTDEMKWRYADGGRTAMLGPPGSPTFVISCADGRGLVFERRIPAQAGGTGTLSFTGNGNAASLPIAAVRTGSDLESHWRADAGRGDMARDVARTFGGGGAVHVSIGGTPPLVVPTAAAVKKLLADCLGG